VVLAIVVAVKAPPSSAAEPAHVRTSTEVRTKNGTS
jgi:hypothetical protein